MNQKNRTLRRLGIAGVATAMATVGVPGLASAATFQGTHTGSARVNDLSAPGAPSGLKATDAGAGPRQHDLPGGNPHAGSRQ